MSDDRELLELAAKAAGFKELPPTEGTFLPSGFFFKGGTWNPLTDDGDEARLEAALGLNVAWDFYSVRVGGVLEIFSRHGGDKQAARRRAGVRAAAAIGKEMP